MIFEYFILDTIDKDLIKNANNNLMKKADELCFGPISDGVLAEIKFAKPLNKPIRYFKIITIKEIKKLLEITPRDPTTWSGLVGRGD